MDGGRIVGLLSNLGYSLTGKYPDQTEEGSNDISSCLVVAENV